MGEVKSSKEVLKSGHEWLEIENSREDATHHVAIWDRDGWRYDDGVTMDTPIALEDFENRLATCTLCLTPRNSDA